MALAVATAIAVMQITNTTHPPAGAEPLVVILEDVSWDFIFVPVLAGSVILVLCALVFNNFAPNREYRRYWS
jgi:CBS-domain-containing membrane protein